jgi:predicted phosphate transport protein (TIGR00153 family)
VAFRLIPREERFYADFESVADEIAKAAVLLQEMLAPDRPIWDKAEEINEREHNCDLLTHQIFQRLNRTFVTPIDREDIHEIARALDDVMDAIDDSSSVIQLYQIDHVRFGARELATVIVASAVQVRKALQALEKRAGVTECAIEIDRLENEADRIHQEAMRRLFADEKDAIAIIKWKEVLDFLELATDKCEDVANALQGVVVKHS